MNSFDASPPSANTDLFFHYRTGSTPSAGALRFLCLSMASTIPACPLHAMWNQIGVVNRGWAGFFLPGLIGPMLGRPFAHSPPFPRAVSRAIKGTPLSFLLSRVDFFPLSLISSKTLFSCSFKLWWRRIEIASLFW